MAAPDLPGDALHPVISIPRHVEAIPVSQLTGIASLRQPLPRSTYAERQPEAAVERGFGLPFVTLRLIDPRFYHLDTALAVLDKDTIA